VLIAGDLWRTRKNSASSASVSMTPNALAIPPHSRRVASHFYTGRDCQACNPFRLQSDSPRTPAIWRVTGRHEYRHRPKS
jgi:hypothetical protein